MSESASPKKVGSARITGRVCFGFFLVKKIDICTPTFSIEEGYVCLHLHVQLQCCNVTASLQTNGIFTDFFFLRRITDYQRIHEIRLCMCMNVHTIMSVTLSHILLIQRCILT